MKTKKYFNSAIIPVLLLLIVTTTSNSFAQSNNPLAVNLNIGTFSLGVSNPSQSNDLTISVFIVPSLIYKRSEFFLGPLWSKREAYQYDTPEANLGALLGYKLHVLKDPRWFQFDLEYNAKLVRWSGKTLIPNHGDSYYQSWNTTDLNHFFGYGITLFLSKSKKVSIFHSLGFGWTYRIENSMSHDNSENHNHLRYNAGIGIQLYKRKKSNI